MDAHTRKLAGWVTAAIGAIIVVLGVFAGPIGLGDSEFGPLQIVGIIIGVVVTAIGIAVARRSPVAAEPATPAEPASAGEPTTAGEPTAAGGPTTAAPSEP